MIKRFLRIENCINQTLNEIGANKIKEENIKILEEMLLVFEPLEIAVKELGENNANLLKAKRILMYICKKQKDINIRMSLEMLEILKRRVEERRNKDLVTLIYVLQNLSYPNANEFFSYSSQTNIKLLGNQLYWRLFASKERENRVSVEEQEILNVEEESNEREPKYEEMQIFINSFLVASKPDTSIKCNIEKYFKNAEGNNQRTKQIERFYQAVLTIQPTSTASERVFSTSGNFITKIRRRSDINTLNALIFLKFYFNKD